MSISIPNVALASGKHDASMPVRAAMLEAWCLRHGVRRYGSLRAGICPCKIGRHISCGCRCRAPWDKWSKAHWIDHTETFSLGGFPAIVTTEPYDLPDERSVAARLEELGMVALQHPTEESSYFPGRTHLVAILKASSTDHYQSREPHAKRWRA